MGEGAAYNYLAMEDAIKDSGLGEKDISNEKTGIIVGSGGKGRYQQIGSVS